MQVSNSNQATDKTPVRRVDSAKVFDYVHQMSLENVAEPQQDQELRKTNRDAFLKSWRTQILEDKVRSGSMLSTGGLLGDGISVGQLNKYIDHDGHLTDVFRTELELIGQAEVAKLENQLLDLQPPEPDFVGIKRRFCRVCESDCKGYSSANFLFQGSNQQRGEFPTFCKKCGCPAYFHNVAEDQQNFPPDLSEILKSNNIQSNDINWNCLLATFLLEKGTTKTISDIVAALKEEGIEVISYTQRYIQSEEAFLLRSRVVDMKFQQQNAFFRQDFKKTNKDNEIKQSISLDALQADERSEQNPYVLERISQQKEAVMREQMTVLDKRGNLKTANTPQVTQHQATEQSQGATKGVKKNKTVRFNENTDANKALPTIPEDDELNDRALNVTQVNQSYSRQVEQVYQELIKRQNLLPETTSELKLALQSNDKPSGKTTGISKAVDEKHQIEFLMRCIDSNQLIQKLLQNEIVFLILSSAAVQNLSKTVQSVFQKFDGTLGTRMLYFSQNKVNSLEDCVQFVPHLFRLSKSIMVSESLGSFTNGQRDRFSKDSYLGQLTKRDDPNFVGLETGFEKQLNPYRENTVTSHYSDRNAVSIQSKLSIINRQKRAQRASLKNDSNSLAVSNELEHDRDENASQASWAKKARLGIAGHKQNKLDKSAQKIRFNHGVMCDFFNYSGMCVQLSHKEIDFCRPLQPGGIRATLASQNADFGSGATQPCNMFAIAKVGLPNLILPNTLDLKFSNFENFSHYIQMCDSFFPELSVNQQTILVLRPIIVRNDLHNLFVTILKANEFVIIHRKTRILTAGEVAYLYKKEAIPEANKELYFDLMMAGPSEILVLSKLSAVADAKTLLNGASPFGRRRLNQLHEDSQNQRSNVDSVSAMFEIAPFTSFSELLDLEDFLSRNSKLSKQQTTSDQSHIYMVHKKEYCTDAIKLFSRFFNLTGYSSPTPECAETEVCIFAPDCAALQEVVLVLNTIYNDILDDCFELIVRQGFQILRHEEKLLSPDEVRGMFSSKVDFTAKDGHQFLETMTQAGAHIFHLVKKAGDQEMRNLYRISDLQFEDLIMPTNFGTPLKPIYFPYIFLFLDTTSQFEAGLAQLYKPEHLSLNGKEMFFYNNNDVMKILQYALLVTMGDTMKMVHTDTFGKTRAVKPTRVDKFEPIHKFVVSGLSQGGKMEAQFLMKTLDDKNGKAPHCSFMVESSCQGVYEVRFMTLDREQDPRELTNQFLQTFTALSLYYQEASKVSSSSVPVFYKYKIGGQIKRAFEVEEYMGDRFMEALAKLHNQHCKIIECYEKYSTHKHTPGYVKPHSLPGHVFGTKLGRMCQQLSTIMSKEVGAGKLSYSEEKKGFVGEVVKVTDSSFYFFDKQRYQNMLTQFEKGWDYFLSSLETDIIKSKLEIVLNSLTFRYSRQPKFLRLVPERLTTDNLRITEKIKMVNPKGLDPEGDGKFFDDDERGEINPDRERQKASKVESEVHALKTAFDEYMAKVKALVKENRDTGKPINTLEISGKDFSVVNDVAISGFKDGISRRPIYHLIASLMWILNYEYKKTNRCSQYFIGDRNLDFAQKDTEAEYDQIIDDILAGMLKAWHCENAEGVDIKKMREDAGGDSNKELDQQVSLQKKLEAEMKLRVEQEIEEQNRNRRMNLDIDELLQMPELFETTADEERQKQMKELKQMLDPKGAPDRDGSEFSGFIEKSKTQFGPFAEKIALSFVRKIDFQMRQKQNPLLKDQELISLVKMEYFLYGVAEANYLIQKLRTMEEQIATMADDLDDQQRHIDLLSAQITQTPSDALHAQQRRDLLQKQNTASSEKVKFENRIFSNKLEIQVREAELLDVFRELISWDFYLADDYFEPKVIEHAFEVPIETYWKPIRLPERLETDYTIKKYDRQVGQLKVNESNFAEFLPAALRQTLLNDPKTKEKIAALQNGHTASQLRKVEGSQIPKGIKLAEYKSMADAVAKQTLAEQEQKLKDKAKGVQYKAEVLI